MFWFLQDNKKEKERVQKIKQIESAVWKFFIDDAKKYGFEEREGQQNMALDIVDAMKSREHILVEAGVGIGKTFAYIVPLLYYYKSFNRPIAIATSTIALQEQLEEDIKTISFLLKIHVPTIIAKGQTHFICKQRLEDYSNTDDGNNKFVHSIIKNANKNKADRKNFPFLIPYEIWGKINIKDYGFKKCNKCKHNSRCYYYKLRKELPSFDGIVICNQDLLTAHLQKFVNWHHGILNKDISIIVIDEAHNLEEKVRNCSTIGYNKDNIIDIVNKAPNIVRVIWSDIEQNIKGFNEKIDDLYYEFEKQIQNKIDEKPEEMKYADRFFLNRNEKVSKLILSLSDYIAKINDFVEIHTDYDNISESLKRAAEDIEDVYSFFMNLSRNAEDYIFWLEKNKYTVFLYQCPKNIDEITYELYFSNQAKTILTSATLSNKGKGSDEERYSYFIKNTGFPVNSGFLSEPKESPFPYDENAMIYYSDDLPHPTRYRENFIEQASERIVELINISEGKALILFTAKSDIEILYEKLSTNKNLSYNILMQKDGASQEEILASFRKDVNSVLLGTGAFWEGINIEGTPLTNLIIFRLPFPVPDPIIEYKKSISKNALMDVYVPEMIIKLKQGIGRLIRSKQDKGIVSIIDSRLKESQLHHIRTWFGNRCPLNQEPIP